MLPFAIAQRAAPRGQKLRLTHRCHPVTTEMRGLRVHVVSIMIVPRRAAMGGFLPVRHRAILQWWVITTHLNLPMLLAFIRRTAHGSR
nr:hypothetical protein [Ktedonobacter racemifer]